MDQESNSLTAKTAQVAQLIATLQQYRTPLSPRALTDILETSEIDLPDLSPWISYDPSVYSRNRIVRLEHVELLVLCWRSKQLTAIHDHAGSACAVKVLHGIATEITYRQAHCGSLVPVGHSRYLKGEVLGSFDSDVHQMGNLEAMGSNLVTLHCYSPPLQKMNVFNEEQTFFHEYDSLYKKVSQRMTHSAPSAG